MQGGRWPLIPSLLGEASYWVGRGRLVRFEEAAMVGVDECVAPRSVCKVVHSEGVGLHLRGGHLLGMVPLECVGEGHAVHRTLLKHFYFINNERLN